MNIYLVGLMGLINLAILAGFFGLRALIQRHRRHISAEVLPDLGINVKMDCRACGQFNRVPGHRLRERPTCGRCRKRLMPWRHIFLCHETKLSGPLRASLAAAWEDGDRLWQCLANHVELEALEARKRGGTREMRQAGN